MTECFQFPTQKKNHNLFNLSWKGPTQSFLVHKKKIILYLISGGTSQSLFTLELNEGGVAEICSFGRVFLMDSGSAPEINHTRLEEDKPGSNPCSDNEKDIQDPSVKPFMPLLTFCKTSGNMKGDLVGKSEKNTQSLGVEQRYSRIEEMSGEVVGDERPKTLAALFSIQPMDHRDSISSSSSGHLIVPGGGGSATSCYDTMSFRSNSTTSTRSFAFPILASDWNGSPMRMAGGDRRFSRKRRQWRMCFGCYNV